MASNDFTDSQRKPAFRWVTNRKFQLPRRRRTPSVRLGGERRRHRGLFIVKMFRRIKVRWLKLQYSCMLKKLKDFYFKAVKDLIEAGATLESVQRRVMMETQFAVPVMGAPSAGISSSYVGYNNQARCYAARSIF